MSSFWLDNPNSLFNKSHISQIWPTSELTTNEKLNAITRLIIILTLVGYMVTKNIKIVVSFFVAIGVIIVMQRTKSNDEIKETFQNEKYLVEKPNILKNNYTVPTKKNPLMNIMMDDYKYNKDKKPAAPSYNENILKQINETAKNPNSELYKNLGDNLKYENSMQNFYTMPNTKIPNDQEAFAKFCYGGMKSCKEGDTFQCTRNNLAGRRGVS